ncbi:protein of unknown function [Methylocaldum szegediense]|uniref:Transposase n=1 Tax=Methylocaldum szegediense TaxID=73780 RepID=A0ABM9I7D1_9GAMM|nr:protein of unknown function [Methylocaldum szegediense]
MSCLETLPKGTYTQEFRERAVKLVLEKKACRGGRRPTALAIA